MKKRFVLAHRFHSRHQPIGLRLQQIAARSGILRLANHLPRIVLREDQHFGGGQRLLDLWRGFQPVHLRHGNVHNHDIGLQLSRHSDGCRAIGGLADNLPLLARGEQPTQGCAHRFFVVHDQDSKSHYAYSSHILSSDRETAISFHAICRWQSALSIVASNVAGKQHTRPWLRTPIAKYVPELIPIYTSSGRVRGHLQNQTLTSLFRAVCANLARCCWYLNCFSYIDLDACGVVCLEPVRGEYERELRYLPGACGNWA